MSIDRRKRVTFEQVADLFDEARPGYPLQLVDDILDLSNISSEAHILEIGCGPGNATLPFAQGGFQITAIELGKRLSDLAAKNLSRFPNVTVINTAFEDWPLIQNAFDLVIAAEAMHWIPPHIGYPKVAASLKHHGAAAFYWNVVLDPLTDLSQAIDAIYDQLAPQVKSTEKAMTVDWLTAIIVNNFLQSGDFREVSVHQYPWSMEFTTGHYLKFLKTSSIHRDLEKSIRDKLFHDIGETIEQYGGRLRQPRLTILFHAKVKSK